MVQIDNSCYGQRSHAFYWSNSIVSSQSKSNEHRVQWPRLLNDGELLELSCYETCWYSCHNVLTLWHHCTYFVSMGINWCPVCKYFVVYRITFKCLCVHIIVNTLTVLILTISKQHFLQIRCFFFCSKSLKAAKLLKK